MTFSVFARRAVQCTVAFVVGVLATQSSVGDVTGSYISATQYDILVTHMPDFDQRRADGFGILGLPNDGNMYCVPTATMNLFAYAANHGFPNLLPGPNWWQGNDLYNEATASIEALGIIMGTHPIDGTNGDGAQSGAVHWLAGSNLTVNSWYAADHWSPTVNDAVNAILDGGIVAVSYSRYKYLGQSGSTHLLGERTGGHRVTFIGATRNGNQLVLRVRDPADDPDYNENNEEAHLYSQSPFTIKSYTTAQNIQAFNLIAGWSRLSTSFVMPPPLNGDDEPIIRLLTSMVVIKPKVGYTWKPGINNLPPDIYLLVPQSFNDALQPPTTITLNGLLNVADFAQSPDAGKTFVLGESAPGVTPVKKVDLATGEMETIIELSRGTDLLFGRKRQLYVLSREWLHRLDVDDESLPNPIVATALPRNPCVAMCYDEINDEVLLLCPSQRKVYKYGELLPANVNPQEICIPTSIPMGTEGSIAINPVDGGLWIMTNASNAMYRLTGPLCTDPVEVASHSTVINPRSISFDDQGHMFIACNAGMKELEYNTKLKRWMPVSNPYFPVVPGSEKFLVSRSQTNFDPAQHLGPDWNNIDPDEEQNLPGTNLDIDCLADLVSSATFQPPPDGTVDGADLAFMLGEWGKTEGSAADIVTSATFVPPDDGLVNGADLAFLLGAWGDCPQPNR